MAVLTLATQSAVDTKALAAALAELAQPGDLLILAGDLGAGKTAFTQGFGRALGVDEQITSPTFTLHREYRGRLDLNHLDVYRLGRLAELADVGLAEMLETAAVTVIEWGDAVAQALPSDYLEIRLRFGAGDDARIIEIEPFGAVWSARYEGVRAALGSWVVTADEVESPGRLSSERLDDDGRIPGC